MRHNKFIPAAFILVALLCMSIFDFTGNYRIQFYVYDLRNDKLIVPGDTFASGAGIVEVVWNTGDTGSTIIIDTPGVYIVSVKDVLTVSDTAGKFLKIPRINNVSYPYTYSPQFIYGYPDGVRIDTFSVDSADFYASENYSFDHTYMLINGGTLYEQTFTDSVWYEAETEKYYFTETHPVYEGFWSGLLDTIIIQDQTLPLMVGAKVMVKDNKVLTGKKWRALY